MTANNADPSRDWSELGEEFIRKAFADGRRFHGDYDRDRERARIAAAIDEMSWREPDGTMPLSPGLFLQAVYPQLAIRPTAAAINSFIELPDGPETGTYTIYGIEGIHNGMRVRMYLIDTGSNGIPIAIDVNAPPAL
ncbi:hypothetical protein [Nucisporomicrobium flavum]|uniref:hypothetical protein n=1 Tax=Nucisporomicrobium flavum TaxID=2785915 RepID=UPI0018F4A97F|nr:hypothetical protein [Nucisporomicrobium flavum]